MQQMEWYVALNTGMSVNALSPVTCVLRAFSVDISAYIRWMAGRLLPQGNEWDQGAYQLPKRASALRPHR